jgi:hypothetical protein
VKIEWKKSVTAALILSMALIGPSIVAIDEYRLAETNAYLLSAGFSWAWLTLGCLVGMIAIYWVALNNGDPIAH